jgi:nitroreductase
METFEVIRKRCSLKAHISSRAIEGEKIDLILQAGSLAASARNYQPWRFIIVQEQQAIQTLTTAFSESNQVIKDAPAILLACGRAVDDNVRDGKAYYLFDIGLAVANMILTATDLGLITHLMTAFDEAQVKSILGIPEDVSVVVATPLAYPTEETYDEAAQERLANRTRKSMAELVFYDHWRESEPA